MVFASKSVLYPVPVPAVRAMFVRAFNSFALTTAAGPAPGTCQVGLHAFLTSRLIMIPSLMISSSNASSAPAGSTSTYPIHGSTSHSLSHSPLLLFCLPALLSLPRPPPGAVPQYRHGPAALRRPGAFRQREALFPRLTAAAQRGPRQKKRGGQAEVKHEAANAQGAVRRRRSGRHGGGRARLGSAVLPPWEG